MNKQQRFAAAERIQKVHEGTAIAIEEGDIYYDDNEVLEAHNHRAELLTLLADAERENDEWRELAYHRTDQFTESLEKLKVIERENDELRRYVGHKCRCKGNHTIGNKCTCGLDELLNKQETE